MAGMLLIRLGVICRLHFKGSKGSSEDRDSVSFELQVLLYLMA